MEKTIIYFNSFPFKSALIKIMHQSIPAVPIPPRALVGHLLTL